MLYQMSVFLIYQVGNMNEVSPAFPLEHHGIMRDPAEDGSEHFSSVQG